MSIDAFGRELTESGQLAVAPTGAVLSANGNYYINGKSYGVAPGGTSTSGDYGIQLPDQPELANQGGSAETDYSKLLSASLPAVDEADIKAQTEAQYNPLRATIEANYQQKIEEQKGLGAEEQRTLSAQLGTGRRFSSSAQAFMKYISNENSKKIATLEVQMEDALANFDFQMADVINSRIQTERANQQQDFDNMTKILQAASQKTTEKKDESIVKSDKDAAILSAISDGDTDIVSIFTKVRESRADITIEDISSSLESMGKSLGIKEGAVDKLTGDSKNFFILKDTPNALPESITNLPENQQLEAYLKWVETGAGSKTVIKGGAVPGMDTYDSNILVARLGKQIYGTRISDAESERVQGFITSGMAQGKSENEIIDDVLGFKIERNRPLAESLKNSLLATTSEEGLAGFDMLGLSRLINAGQDSAAIQKVENFKMQEAQKLVGSDTFVTESDVKYVSDKVDEITALLGAGWSNEVGAFSGNFGAWINKKFGGFGLAGDSVKIKAKITSLTASMVNKRAGSALTDTEWNRLVAANVPQMNEAASTWATKMSELVDDPLTRLNSQRQMVVLPELSRENIKDPTTKIGVYSKITPSFENAVLKDELDNFALPDEDFWGKQQ